MPGKMKRWYDKDLALATQIDALARTNVRAQFEIVKGLVDLIKKEESEILQRFHIPDDIERWYRRWYDRDPTCWLVFNSLQFAEEDLLQKVAQYLEQMLRQFSD